MNNQIHWYPGHMHKSWNAIKDNAKAFDFVFLLLDARAPISSFIEDFKTFLKNKQVIILITKSDLVEKEKLSAFINYYKKDYKHVYPISLLNKQKTYNKIVNILENIPKKNLIPKGLILGTPNVGKSSLLNTILKQRKAKTEDRAGVTRNLSWYPFLNKYWILDTPGILEPKYENNEQSYHLALIGAFKYENLPTEEIYHYLKENFNIKQEKSNYNDPEYYKNQLIAFRKGKLGKIILDKIEK